MTSIPPMNVNARMVTSAWLNRASRRSSWIPPRMATAVCSGGTTHRPFRSTPLNIATEAPAPGLPPIRPAGKRAGASVNPPGAGPPAAGRSAVTTASSP